ncbi:MAG: MFS transporter [Bacteroidota bacterium]
MTSDPDNRPSGLLARRFPALRHSDFRYLWFGQIVSVAGSQMQNVAINWQVYQVTHSAKMLGLIGLFRVIPIVIFSLFGGVVADVYNRRKILFFTQSVMMLSAIGLALSAGLGNTSTWVVLMLTALAAAAGAFDGPARQSLIPNLVPPEDLTNAISLNTMMFQASMIIGPALSGLVIAAYGVDAVYWINAATFLAVIGALVLMRAQEHRETSTTKVDFASLLEGLRFVRHSPMILSTMLLDFFATFFSSATALLPIFAQDILHVGARGLGILYAAESVGSLAAGFGMSLFGEIRRKGRLLLGSVAAYGAATAIYAFSHNFYLSLLLLGLVGIGDSISTVLRVTIRQRETPDYIRGRMTAVNMIFFMGGPQLGNLEAGLLAGWIGGATGAIVSVATGGVATIIFVGLTAWLYPQLRKYND